MKTPVAVLAAIVSIVCSVPSFGQQGGSAPATVEYRKWDVTGGFGIMGTSGRDFGGSQFPGGGVNTEPAFTWNIDAGRYFTTHLKADVGLMGTSSRSTWNNYFFSNGQTTGYSTRRIVHPKSVSVAGTYQFFENVFAHPYVSAGIRVTSMVEEQLTYIYAQPYFPPPTPSTASKDRFAETRPFVAAGYKSYFNERAYMRSELFFAFDRHGVSNGALRIGFGMDF